jgi:hypothetical protein
VFVTRAQAIMLKVVGSFKLSTLFFTGTRCLANSTVTKKAIKKNGVFETDSAQR